MKGDENKKSPHRLWAEFRFSVIGALLSSPKGRGELASEVRSLANKTWLHPISGKEKQFKFSTIEGWYYAAKNGKSDPVGTLRSKTRSDLGKSRRIDEGIALKIADLYARFPYWSYQLHADNLRVAIQKPGYDGLVPSYPTVRRYMKARGLIKRRKPRDLERSGAALHRLTTREVRSYEAAYVNALWHLDYHKSPLKVLGDDGSWQTPIVLGVFDDHSRLACHVQWYLEETAENLVHAFSQALAKRAVPRELLNDNGSAMISAEFTTGLKRLGITANTTLPYSPYQNGKCEFVWNKIEGRLMAMLAGYKDLRLKTLNDFTQAWAEMEYNRTLHDEIKVRPIDRYQSSKDVGGVCPSFESLRLAFQREVTRTQRKSDGTISLDGMRYEIPSRFRHLERLHIKYAQWDMSQVYLMDFRTGEAIARIYPIDKVFNASGRRRVVEDPVTILLPEATTVLPPLLQKLIDDYAALGLRPAYLPKTSTLKKENDHACE